MSLEAFGFVEAARIWGGQQFVFTKANGIQQSIN